MKKYLILPVIALVAMFGFSGVASAATCSPQLSTIYYDGQWASDVNLYGCDHVNGAQFQGLEYGTDTGIAWPLHARDYATTTPTAVQTSVSSLVNWYWTFRVPVFGPGCGSSPITVQSHFFYKIRNSVGNTWGSWHQVLSVNQTIC